MMNRISNRLIARFVAVAALLALVMAAPAVFAQDSEVDYAENGTEPVARFSATDADGDPITFSLSGDDAAKFAISEDGELSFKSSPNFESPGDADADNVYMVTVRAARGSTDVAVTVTNVDEAGSVSLSDLQPQAGAGQSVSASVSDTDGSPVSTAWQWSRSMDAASWTDIAGATAATYTPQEEDDGYYLRATATYSDGFGAGRDSASGESAFPVEIRPTANFTPSFEVQDETGPAEDDDTDTAGTQDNIVITRSVSETAKIGASIGNAVVATDADNDPLLYTLADYDDPDQVDDAEVDDSRWFKIDRKAGQISAATPSNQAALTAALNQEPTADATTSFMVRVTATDPSGADATETVTINVAGVNEAPVITRVDDDLDSATNIITAGPDNFLVNTDEQDQLDPEEATGTAAQASADLPVFQADDPETDDAGDAAVEWSVSGPDAGRFQIVKLGTAATPPAPTRQAALRFTTPYPSFEAMDSADGTNVYVVVVSAYDGVARSSKTVTVTVDNVEEDGTVSLSQRRPQEGIPITASLSDPDGNITGTSWQWYRGAGSLVGNDDALLTNLVKCSADAADPATTPL